jgi:hypothetical protein
MVVNPNIETYGSLFAMDFPFVSKIKKINKNKNKRVPIFVHLYRFQRDNVWATAYGTK